MTIHKDILEIIDEISRPRSLNIDDFDRSLEEYGLDSLDIMTLIMDVEEKYSIKLSVKEAEELSTVNQFVAVIESKKSN